MTFAPAAPARGGLLLPAYTLWQREVVRFLRQRNRVFSALAQPILFWGLFGALFSGRAFAPAAGIQNGYIEYYFPGTLLLIVLFTAIFATFSTIEDRREGFLQSVIVAPVPRAAVVLGKVLGGATLATGQAAVFLCFAPAVGISLTLLSVALTVGVLALAAIGLTGLGMAFALRMESTQGFHAVMMLVLMPLWLLSGAFFPAEGVAPWLEGVIRANPVSYAVSALTHALYLDAPAAPWTIADFAPSVAVAAGFAAATFAAATLLARGPSQGDLL